MPLDRYSDIPKMMDSPVILEFLQWLKTNLPVIGLTACRLIVKSHFKSSDGRELARHLNVTMVRWSRGQPPPPLWTRHHDDFPSIVVGEIAIVHEIVEHAQEIEPGPDEDSAIGVGVEEFVAGDEDIDEGAASAPEMPPAQQPGNAVPGDDQQANAAVGAAAGDSDISVAFDDDTKEAMFQGHSDHWTREDVVRHQWRPDGTFMGLRKPEILKSKAQADAFLRQPTLGGACKGQEPNVNQVRKAIYEGQHGMCIVNTTCLWNKAASVHC